MQQPQEEYHAISDQVFERPLTAPKGLICRVVLGTLTKKQSILLSSWPVQDVSSKKLDKKEYSLITWNWTRCPCCGAEVRSLPSMPPAMPLADVNELGVRIVSDLVFVSVSVSCFCFRFSLSQALSIHSVIFQILFYLLDSWCFKNGAIFIRLINDFSIIWLIFGNFRLDFADLKLKKRF